MMKQIGYKRRRNNDNNVASYPRFVGTNIIVLVLLLIVPVVCSSFSLPSPATTTTTTRTRTTIVSQSSNEQQQQHQRLLQKPHGTTQTTRTNNINNNRRKRRNNNDNNNNKETNKDHNTNNHEGGRSSSSSSSSSSITNDAGNNIFITDPIPTTTRPCSLCKAGSVMMLPQNIIVAGTINVALNRTETSDTSDSTLLSTNISCATVEQIAQNGNVFTIDQCTTIRNFPSIATICGCSIPPPSTISVAVPSSSSPPVPTPPSSIFTPVLSVPISNEPPSSLPQDTVHVPLEEIVDDLKYQHYTTGRIGIELQNVTGLMSKNVRMVYVQQLQSFIKEYITINYGNLHDNEKVWNASFLMQEQSLLQSDSTTKRIVNNTGFGTNRIRQRDLAEEGRQLDTILTVSGYIIDKKQSNSSSSTRDDSVMDEKEDDYGDELSLTDLVQQQQQQQQKSIPSNITMALTSPVLIESVIAQIISTHTNELLQYLRNSSSDDANNYFTTLSSIASKPLGVNNYTTTTNSSENGSSSSSPPIPSNQNDKKSSNMWSNFWNPVVIAMFVCIGIIVLGVGGYSVKLLCRKITKHRNYNNNHYYYTNTPRHRRASYIDDTSSNTNTLPSILEDTAGIPITTKEQPTEVLLYQLGNNGTVTAGSSSWMFPTGSNHTDKSKAPSYRTFGMLPLNTNSNHTSSSKGPSTKSFGLPSTSDDTGRSVAPSGSFHNTNKTGSNHTTKSWGSFGLPTSNHTSSTEPRRAGHGIGTVMNASGTDDDNDDDLVQVRHSSSFPTNSNSNGGLVSATRSIFQQITMSRSFTKMASSTLSSSFWGQQHREITQSNVTANNNNNEIGGENNDEIKMTLRIVKTFEDDDDVDNNWEDTIDPINNNDDPLGTPGSTKRNIPVFSSPMETAVEKNPTKSPFSSDDPYLKEFQTTTIYPISSNDEMDSPSEIAHTISSSCSEDSDNVFVPSLTLSSTKKRDGKGRPDDYQITRILGPSPDLHFTGSFGYASSEVDGCNSNDAVVNDLASVSSYSQTSSVSGRKERTSLGAFLSHSIHRSTKTALDHYSSGSSGHGHNNYSTNGLRKFISATNIWSAGDTNAWTTSSFSSRSGGDLKGNSRHTIGSGSRSSGRSATSSSNLGSSNPSGIRRYGLKTESVMAPPGKLGIIIDTTDEGPVIYKVDPDSPLLNAVFPGDFIVAINNTDTREMSGREITALMVQTAYCERKLTILREDDIDRAYI